MSTAWTAATGSRWTTASSCTSTAWDWVATGWRCVRPEPRAPPRSIRSASWRYRKNTNILLSERDEIEDALLEVTEELEGVKSEDTATEEPVQKYQKVKLDEDECREIVSRMRTYIEQGKVYANVDLKMKDIADELHLSPSKLSQVFSLYLNENYYDFINRYRLEEFKRLIAAGAHRQYTITALSEQCGFKKSNFFSTFRKVEGMTPTEYLRKNGIR